MILVAVGNDHAADAVPVGPQIADIRDDHVHAVEILIGKTHAAVHQENIFAVLIDGQVFSDFTQAA